MLYISIGQLPLKYLYPSFKSMHLALIGSLGSFNLHPPVSVLFLEDISRSHDSQVVLEALGKIFAQLKVK